MCPNLIDKLSKASTVATVAVITWAAAALLNPAHALIRSADSLGMCFDAEGGIKEGARIISWHCTDQSNQQFWLDWWTKYEKQDKGLGADDPVATLRLGNTDWCIMRADYEAILTKNSQHCSKTKAAVHYWYAWSVGGTRYRIEWPGGQEHRCATLTNHTQAGAAIHWSGCINGLATTGARVVQARQYWWVKQ